MQFVTGDLESAIMMLAIVTWMCVEYCSQPQMETIMATYGVDYKTGVARTGFINAVVQPNSNPVLSFVSWSPTLAPNTTGPAAAGVPAIQTNGVTSADDALSKAFRKNGPTIEALRAMVTQLLAGNANTGVVTYPQIKGQTADQGMGGKRPIDNAVILNNRAFTAADKAALSAIFARSAKPLTYPTDPSRNGGGGKGAW